MIEFLTAMSVIMMVFLLAVVVNRNLVYLAAITLIALILSVLDYSVTDNRYFAILCITVLFALAAKFYEHYSK